MADYSLLHTGTTALGDHQCADARHECEHSSAHPTDRQVATRHSQRTRGLHRRLGSFRLVVGHGRRGVRVRRRRGRRNRALLVGERELPQCAALDQTVRVTLAGCGYVPVGHGHRESDLERTNTVDGLVDHVVHALVGGVRLELLDVTFRRLRGGCRRELARDGVAVVLGPALVDDGRALRRHGHSRDLAVRLDHEFLLLLALDSVQDGPVARIFLELDGLDDRLVRGHGHLLNHLSGISVGEDRRVGDLILAQGHRVGERQNRLATRGDCLVLGVVVHLDGRARFVGRDERPDGLAVLDDVGVTLLGGGDHLALVGSQRHLVNESSVVSGQGCLRPGAILGRAEGDLVVLRSADVNHTGRREDGIRSGGRRRGDVAGRGRIRGLGRGLVGDGVLHRLRRLAVRELRILVGGCRAGVVADRQASFRVPRSVLDRELHLGCVGAGCRGLHVNRSRCDLRDRFFAALLAGPGVRAVGLHERHLPVLQAELAELGPVDEGDDARLDLLEAERDRGLLDSEDAPPQAEVVLAVVAGAARDVLVDIHVDLTPIGLDGDVEVITIGQRTMIVRRDGLTPHALVGRWFVAFGRVGGRGYGHADADGQSDGAEHAQHLRSRSTLGYVPCFGHCFLSG